MRRYSSVPLAFIMFIRNKTSMPTKGSHGGIASGLSKCSKPG